MPKIVACFEQNYRCYGHRKIRAALKRDGVIIGADRCRRLMRQAGIQGAKRGKRVRTTIPARSARTTPRRARPPASMRQHCSHHHPQRPCPESAIPTRRYATPAAPTHDVCCVGTRFRRSPPHSIPRSFDWPANGTTNIGHFTSSIPIGRTGREWLLQNFHQRRYESVRCSMRNTHIHTPGRTPSSQVRHSPLMQRTACSRRSTGASQSAPSRLARTSDILRSSRLGLSGTSMKPQR